MKPQSPLSHSVHLGAITDPLAQQALAYCGQQRVPVLLVGGCVRDILLGRATNDLDLVVPEQAIALARRLADAFGGAFVPVDAGRDVGRAVLFSATMPPTVVDVAAWRASSLEEDLRLRDFTINALAVPLTEAFPTAIDVTGGLTDLDQRLVRMTSARAFGDDPLRMLRGVRLLAELAPWGFRLEAETAEQVRHQGSALVGCSAERVRDELVRILSAERPEEWLQQLADFGLLPYVLPELEALRGVNQSYPHRWDAFEHTVRTVAHTAWLQSWLKGEAAPVDPADTALAAALDPYRDRLAAHFAQGEGVELRSRASLMRWAALCHDWGKPDTVTVELGDTHAAPRIQFIGHEQRSAELTQEALRRLRFNESAVRSVSTIVANHMRPLFLAADPQQPSTRAIFRYFRELGDLGLDVAMLSLSDLRATADSDPAEASWQRTVKVVIRLVQGYFERFAEVVAPPALIDGNELMTALGLRPGPLIGQLLMAVVEAQATGEVNSTQEALDYAAQLAARSKDGHNMANSRVVTLVEHPRGI